MYEVELKAYEDRLQQWLPVEDGRWVVINGDQVLGLFDTKGEAFKKAVEAYGDTAFLVRQVLAQQPVHTVPFLVK